MFLDSLFASTPPDPTDDFWFKPIAHLSKSGKPVSPETAIRLTAVWSCVRILTETIGSVPMITYRRLADDGREPAKDLPIFRLLAKRPNPWQTALEFKEMMQFHVSLRGNAYAEIIDGPSGPFDKLIPLHPDLIEPKFLSDFTVEYEVRSIDGGKTRTIPMQNMLHLRGPMSRDGLKGLSPIDEEREAVGFAMATEEYGSRFFRNMARPPGVIEAGGTFKSQEAANEFRRRWQESQTGVNLHKTAVLPPGMTYKSIGLSNDQAQFLETRSFSVKDIARIFRIPPHMINEMGEATFSNIEQQALDFVMKTMSPWFERWEQAIERALLPDTDELFVEFFVDRLLRGDIKTRFGAYRQALGGAPFMTVNEIRVKENMSRLPDGDELPKPLNMKMGGDGEDREDRDQAIAEFAKSEIEAVQAAASAKEIGAFMKWARRFYGKHVGQVVQSLDVAWSAAQAYCDRCIDELKAAENMTQVSETLNSWELHKETMLRQML